MHLSQLAADAPRLGERQREADPALLAGAPEASIPSSSARRGITTGCTAPGVAGPRVLSSAARRARSVRTRGRCHSVDPGNRLCRSRPRQGEHSDAFASSDRFRAICRSAAARDRQRKKRAHLRLAAATARRARRAAAGARIALTPAVAGIFRSTFGERVAIQHSACPTASVTISGIASAAATWISWSGHGRRCSLRCSGWG